MVRTEDWKYVHWEGFRPQLFDLDADPQELVDLGADARHDAVRARMRERLFDWLATAKRRTTVSDDVVASAHGYPSRARHPHRHLVSATKTGRIGGETWQEATMNTHADDGRARQLDAVLGLVRTRTTAVQREVLERFVVRYFGQVDPEDLAERTPADLYGAALSHWNFARKREPGTPGCASSTRRSRSTAGSRRTRSSRSSTTTCRSWSTR